MCPWNSLCKHTFIFLLFPDTKFVRYSIKDLSLVDSKDLNPSLLKFNLTCPSPLDCLKRPNIKRSLQGHFKNRYLFNTTEEVSNIVQQVESKRPEVLSVPKLRITKVQSFHPLSTLTIRLLGIVYNLLWFWSPKSGLLKIFEILLPVPILDYCRYDIDKTL